MPNDYAKMTADLIARMSRPRDHALCATCHASIPAVADTLDYQCLACSAGDSCDDIELEAFFSERCTLPTEVACG